MPRKPVIRNLDDFISEAKMLPALEERVFAVTDPLEAHFMRVADKHGVLDQILDQYNGNGDAYFDEDY